MTDNYLNKEDLILYKSLNILDKIISSKLSGRPKFFIKKHPKKFGYSVNSRENTEMSNLEVEPIKKKRGRPRKIII